MIDVNWHKANMIYMQFRRGWTWEHLREALHQTDHMIASQSEAVHVVIDVREAGSIPSDLRQVIGELLASGEARANEGEKIIVGAGRLLRMAYAGLSAVYDLRQRPLRFAADLTEAEALAASPTL